MRYILFITVILLAASCKKQEEFSTIPEVAFQEYRVYTNAAGKDTAMDFIFTFKDGDGNIGSLDNEIDNSCGAPLPDDLTMVYEEKKGSGFYPKKLWTTVIHVDTNCDTTTFLDSVTISFNQRLQYVEPAGKKKQVEGTVVYNINNLNFQLLSADGRFVFHIHDRAKNLSNVIATPELILNK